MSNYTTPFGKYTQGSIPEERYSFDRYYCPGCKLSYRTYFTFRIPSQFINTPTKSYNLEPIWSCPTGCTFQTSATHQPDHIPFQLSGKCNPNKPGKNCFTKFTYVQPFDPNYSNECLRPAGNREEPLYGVHNNATGINNNISSHDHDVLLEPFHPSYDRQKNKQQQLRSSMLNTELEHFSPPYTIHIDKHNLATNNIQTCSKPRPRDRLPIYSQNNYNDNNYYGYMSNIDWTKRNKQICPNPYDIWSRPQFK